MLIRFTLQNFLSFRDRMSFSMIPGTTRTKKEHKNLAINGVSTLKSGVLYGYAESVRCYLQRNESSNCRREVY